MNVIQFQAKKETRSSLQAGHSKSHSQPSVLSFPQGNKPRSQVISEEEREKALALLLKEAEELDQA